MFDSCQTERTFTIIYNAEYGFQPKIRPFRTAQAALQTFNSMKALLLLVFDSCQLFRYNFGSCHIVRAFVF